MNDDNDEVMLQTMVGEVVRSVRYGTSREKPRLLRETGNRLSLEVRYCRYEISLV